MWQIIHCQGCLPKGSLLKLQMADLLQEAAGPLAAFPYKVPMAKSVCGNSGPPWEPYADITSAVQAKPLLFGGPERAAKPTALSRTTHHARDALFSVKKHAAVPCALNCFQHNH